MTANQSPRLRGLVHVNEQYRGLRGLRSRCPEYRPPGLDYYRQARREFARLYRKHGLNPPRIAAGSHVSLCRDIYRHREEILAN
jgi:hypothetical protein